MMMIAIEINLIEVLHILCFYILFFIQNHKLLRNFTSNKIVKLGVCLALLVVGQFVITVYNPPIPVLMFLTSNLATIIILLLITYFVFKLPGKSEKMYNSLLKTNLMLSMDGFMTIQITCAFLDRYITQLIRTFSMVIIVHNIIEAIFAVCLGLIFKKLYNSDNTLEKKINKVIFRMVVVMFLFAYSLTFMFTITHTLSEKIDWLLIFLLVQLILFWLLYFMINRREKERIQSELVEDRLNNLKNYTDYLEKEQRKLRKFKHDYQNMVLSLEVTLRNNDNFDEVHKYIDTFKKYSDQYISENKLWLFNDFDNIKNPYLKSVLINEISQAVDADIDVHFECRTEIERIDMQPYDLVRIVSIAFDNAMEEVRGMDKEHAKINVMIFKGNHQVEITIANPVRQQKNLQQIKQEGVTSKAGHSGFGLTNIQEISEQYSNVLVHYTQDDWFKIQFVIMDKN